MNLINRIFNLSDDNKKEKAVVTDEDTEPSPLEKHLKPYYGDCRHKYTNKIVDAMLQRMFFSAPILVGLSKDLLKALFSSFGHTFFESLDAGFGGCKAFLPFDRPRRYRKEEITEDGTEFNGFRTFLVDFHKELFEPVRQKSRSYDYGQVKRYHVFAVLVVNKPIPTDGEVYTLPMLERKFYTAISYRYDETEFHFCEISLGDFEDMLKIEEESQSQEKEATL